jgi:hypothetical protein
MAHGETPNPHGCVFRITIQDDAPNEVRLLDRFLEFYHKRAHRSFGPIDWICKQGITIAMNSETKPTDVSCILGNFAQARQGRGTVIYCAQQLAQGNQINELMRDHPNCVVLPYHNNEIGNIPGKVTK